MASLKFKRGERLKSSKVISKLFSGNCKSVKAFPLLAVYTLESLPQSAFPAQVSFSVPKKNFRSAVTRNKIKRLMREAYRLTKKELYDSLDSKNLGQLCFMVIYVGPDIPDFNIIDSSIRKIIRKLIQHLQ